MQRARGCRDQAGAFAFRPTPNLPATPQRRFPTTTPGAPWRPRSPGAQRRRTGLGNKDSPGYVYRRSGRGQIDGTPYQRASGEGNRGELL